MLVLHSITTFTPMPQKPPFGVRIPDELEEKLKAIADADRRTLHWLVLTILTEYAEKEYPKVKKAKK